MRIRHGQRRKSTSHPRLRSALHHHHHHEQQQQYNNNNHKITSPFYRQPNPPGLPWPSWCAEKRLKTNTRGPVDTTAASIVF